MDKKTKIIILAIVALAVIATFMLKEKDTGENIISEQKELPVLLDLSMKT